MTGLEAYENDKVYVSFVSNVDTRDAESLIGKTVARVSANDYELQLFFTDGTMLQIQESYSGGRYITGLFDSKGQEVNP